MDSNSFYYTNSDGYLTCGSGLTVNSSNVACIMRNAIDKLQGNNNKSMKIGKQEVYKIVLRETVVREYTYNVLAESKKDAIKEIESGENYNRSDKLVSTEVVEVK